MPTAQKVGWAKLKVGVMAIAAMIILGVLIFLLTGTGGLFAEKVMVHTYMPDSAGIGSGAPVRLNGILIGSVDSVQLADNPQPGRVIRMNLEVRQEMLSDIPVDSLAAVSAQNVLGEKFINIRRGQSRQTIQAGAEVPAMDTTDFEEVVQQGYALLASLQGILKRVDAIVSLVEVGQGSIGKLLVDEELYDRIIAMVAAGQQITSALSSDKGTIGKLIYDDALYTDLRQTMARVDTLVADLEKGQGTAGKLLKDDALYTDLRQTLGEVRKTVEDLNAGKGTAGKLLKSEELHDDLRAVVADIDLMLDKINSGQGTIGQLLVNQQLYDSLNGMTREAQQLVQDIRANPRKFLRIKLALF